MSDVTVGLLTDHVVNLKADWLKKQTAPGSTKRLKSDWTKQGESTDMEGSITTGKELLQFD